MSEVADTVSTNDVRTLVARLGDDFVARSQQQTGALPRTAYDADWPSVCVVERASDEDCYWQPVAMDERPDFSRLATALDVPVAPALRDVFSVRWSGGLPMTYLDNDLELLQLWNEQEFENLLANQIGHALEKKRIRQPLTLFFALVDDERLLTVDNDTGIVYLETLGQRHPLEVSPSLAEFLAQLEPRVSGGT